MYLSLRKVVLVVILFALSFSLQISADSLRKRATPNSTSGNSTSGAPSNSTSGTPSKIPLSTTISHGPTITGITNSTAPSGKNGTTGNDTLPYVDPMTPPVTITLTHPTPAKNLLFKIGTNITFTWKYSANFSIPPKYINVLAQPSVSLDQYFTVVANASGNITSAIWDTGEPSLPVTKYKLYIFDERGKDAGALPGRLLSYTGFTFSLYQPKDRVDISRK
ncbi:23900_t:CDS:2 [Dentiscutata erythropus]|uniref:23900_t:CDS:1 n=1 Tax=Dentiscutata erythropus TaxID=1348616 RepID=A0A9N9D6C0_9GLOM|nr:23900_t:CDS:2 [Dentiscutata erythropus]